MTFWRICRRRYVAEAASGEGAYLYGGRWNSRGVRVVYASTSLALAAIEMFVNLEPRLQPKDLVSIEGEIPEALEIERVSLAAPPPHWDKSRDESVRRWGPPWFHAGRTVALLRPAATIPRQWNILLNPAHAEFKRVHFHEPKAFEFDVRMFRG